jgi:alpha-glucoside transport system permease protein
MTSMTLILQAVFFILIATASILALFSGVNLLLNHMPRHWERRLRPYAFMGPAIMLVSLFFMYPLLRTLVASLLDARGRKFVGINNYLSILGDENVRTAIINSVQWTIIAPVLCIIFGLIVAVLADRLTARWEAIVKSIIFMPLAISFVGAGTIWKFVYDFRPPSRPQIGLLNGISATLGGGPHAFLSLHPLNVTLLMWVLVWMQTGFATVLLSAAVKQIPRELIEAARVDGASEFQTFWWIVFPEIRSTLSIVLTVIAVVALKSFDVVYAMTGGNFGTEVIANRFFREAFQFRQFGRGAALAIILMMMTLPFIIINIRRYLAYRRVT